MSKCSKSNWSNYIEGFCMWNVCFDINGLSINITNLLLISWHFRKNIPKYYQYYLNRLTFKENMFSVFCADFLTLSMVINSTKYKSKYPNTNAMCYEWILKKKPTNNSNLKWHHGGNISSMIYGVWLRCRIVELCLYNICIASHSL